MKHILTAVLLMSGITVAAAQSTDTSPLPMAAPPTVDENPSLVQEYQATITPEDLASHLYFFASDFFEGRETTTRGQRMAAQYLAAQYRKMGLVPKGTHTTENPHAPEKYLQPFTVFGRKLQKAELNVKVGEEQVASSTYSSKAQDDQAYLLFGNRASVEGSVVFAGYGIADDALGYNDYAALKAAGIDHAGKWLLMLRDEPLADSTSSLLPTGDGKPSKWTSGGGSDKFRLLFQMGLPAGILMVTDVGPMVERSVGEAAREAAQNINTGVGSLSLSEPGGGFAFPPLYAVSSAFANQILAPSGKTVEDLKKEIDTTLQPVGFEVEGAMVSSTLTHEVSPLETENVLAFIEGSDPELKDEAVIISSHYDHVGIDPNLKGDQIHNGADDDGSGTVTTLEIAEAFMAAKEAGHGPRRSILFLNVSGEEKGLLGSAYYTDQEPVWPLEKTVANLNIDMIGRFDPTHPTAETKDNYVYIIGSNLISQELHDINTRVNDLTETNLVLDERFNSKDDPNQFYRRSDHWNFGKHNIPFVFYFTGTHDDYHQPGDHADKIAYERMSRIARHIFATAWQVANQDAAPAVSGEGFN